MKNKLKVGFIGLGLMGKPMAENILKKGFHLAVYNRNPKKTDDFAKMGVPVFKTPQELAQTSNVIITMVTGPSDVKEVLLGKQGVIHEAPKGTIIIDMSTIGPTAAVEINKKLKKNGLKFLDAPVTGSTPKAISGELTIFVGGERNIFEKVKPILRSLGKDIHYMGETGSGQAIKLVNNLIVAITIEALAEGMLLSDAQDLPRKKVAQALAQTPAFSPFMRLKLPNMVSGRFPALFSVRNMLKDLRLAEEEAMKGKIHLPGLTLARQLFQKGQLFNLGEEDISAILKVFKKPS